MQAYQIVQKAREISRPSTIEVIDYLCTDFIECHGDRLMADDAAIVGGVGLFNNQPITVVGIQKGNNTKENIRRNFGSAGPAGYRKAQRLMKQAEKFNRPVLTLINTAGAYAAPESEDYGIGEAIASSLLLMSELKVPTIAIVLGEGGSGGAIALALSDRVWMLENSIYSILSPEGFASILWKDSKLASQAADVMKLTAAELLEMKVIDQIIPESHNGKALSKDAILAEIDRNVRKTFEELTQFSIEELLQARHERFRKY